MVAAVITRSMTNDAAWLGSQLAVDSNDVIFM